MHRDLFQQAFSAMRHDLRRTLLTMAGMAWGIATVVLLLAYGNGFGRAIQNIFESFGATAVGVFPGRTSQQAGGNKAGVQIRFTGDDIELLRNNIPLCRHVVRMSNKDSTVQNGNRSFTFPVTGLDPAIEEIWNLDMEEGRFLDDADNMRHGLYAVIGSEARDKLFSGMPAVDEYIRINGVTFEIIGVVKPRMQEGDSDDNRTIYIPFNSMDVIKDNHYLDGIVKKADKIDIVLDVTGPLAKEYGNSTLAVELPIEEFLVPLETIVKSRFITARAAARHMIRQNSGVIIFITGSPARGHVPGATAIGAAFGALENLTENLALELGPFGVRVVCLRTLANIDSRSIQDTMDILAGKLNITQDQAMEQIAHSNVLKVSATVQDTANAAVLIASDRGRLLTATVVNATAGAALD